jgi:transcriptional regulator with XRE-family HTH domain
MLGRTGGGAMADAMGGWLERGGSATAETDAGAVIRAWRKRTGRTQADVAAMLETTQQHLSQIEKGIRPLSLDQRRQIVARLGIAPEELGLSSGQARQLVAADDANPEIGASRSDGARSAVGSTPIGPSSLASRWGSTRRNAGFPEHL